MKTIRKKSPISFVWYILYPGYLSTINLSKMNIGQILSVTFHWNRRDSGNKRQRINGAFMSWDYLSRLSRYYIIRVYNKIRKKRDKRFIILAIYLKDSEKICKGKLSFFFSKIPPLKKKRVFYGIILKSIGHNFFENI